MERQNAEHSIVAAEVEDTSSNHDKGPLTSISTLVESHVSKEPKSFPKDLSHLKLSVGDIISATNNFATFYTDYVKDESKRFWTEVSMLSSLKHKNLASLIGFHDECGLLKICLGVANALSYIHNDVGRDFSVIHCNIKSSNILLDDKCEPKLSGFKRSLKIPVARRHRLVLTHDIVKNAYLDPKYIKSGGVTHKSDVYSFGGITDNKDKDKEEDENGDEDKDEINDELGEALLSQPAKSHLHDMVSPIGKQMDLEAFKIFSDTSNWCIKEDRADCPYIDQVVKRLQKALELQWKHENPVKLKGRILVPLVDKAPLIPRLQTYFDLQPYLNDESVIKINGEDKIVGSLVRVGQDTRSRRSGKLEMLSGRNLLNFEMKAIQDAITAGIIPPKTDREILAEVTWSTNRGPSSTSPAPSSTPLGLDKCYSPTFNHETSQSGEQDDNDSDDGNCEYDVDIYDDKDYVENQRYEGLIDHWRRHHSDKDGNFRTRENETLYAEIKAIQDAITAGTIPPKTDREILAEVTWSTNRAHIAGIPDLYTPHVFPDYVSTPGDHSSTSPAPSSTPLDLDKCYSSTFDHETSQSGEQDDNDSDDGNR
nr:protein kinase-like domain, phloem protein 2-like protein [Tanacetum cinerariifolium]